jgi:hypothetical protein
LTYCNLSGHVLKVKIKYDYYLICFKSINTGTVLYDLPERENPTLWQNRAKHGEGCRTRTGAVNRRQEPVISDL